MTQAEDELQLMHDIVKEYGEFSDHSKDQSKNDPDQSAIESQGHVVVRMFHD